MKSMKATVIGTKMSKTATVQVVRYKVHPFYKKRIKKKKKYLAHDELGAKMGDQVAISETRPLSKRKRWKIIKIVKRK